MLSSIGRLGLAALLSVSAFVIPLSATAQAGSLVTGRVIGKVAVAPLTGDDFTPFSGGLTKAQCPAGTVDTYFDVYGQDIGVGAPRGSGDLGYLGVGNKEGRGPQRFVGASIANLRTAFGGSFSESGTYRIRFGCGNAEGQPFAAYESVMTYTAGGNGSYRIAAPLFVPEQAPAVTTSASPAARPSSGTSVPSPGATAPSAAAGASPGGDASGGSGLTTGPGAVAADGDEAGTSQTGLLVGALAVAALALGGVGVASLVRRRRAASG